MNIKGPIDPLVLFGFMLLVLLALLAAIIAIGKVTQETSYGLEYILGSLATLAGGFAQWAFKTKEDKDNTNGKESGQASPKNN